MKNATNLDYPVQLEVAEEGGFVVSFPDVPEAHTQGENEDDALRHAADALETAFEFYTDAGQDLPRPSRPKPGQHTVRPCDETVIKLSAYQEMRK
jgi:antitoxin HicB